MLIEISVAVFAGFLGAIIKDHIVRPLREYREVRKKIAKDLIMYSNVITSPGAGSNMDEAAYELRSDAAELRATMEDLPGYRFWSSFWIPKRKNLEQVEGRLIRLSNSIHSGNSSKNHKDQQKIRELLNIGG
jgi:hypothetical protein